MLKRIYPTFRVIRPTARLLSSDGKDDGKPVNTNSKEVLGDELLDAVNSVADDLHKNDPVAKKATKNTLISKLISHEKATFDEATGAQMQEMLDDKAIQGLLSSVATTTQTSTVLPNKSVLSGIKPAEAQKLAENAVTEAQQRLTAQRRARIEGVKEEEDSARAQKAERAESEQKFYDYAMQMAE
ncbi:hypothetical protein ANCCEY_04376 [Ancylostoma ceylanicum]|uniref:Uncharacterized protein n=1 Tax=Ancylostoma ceylanicum TaxID=53326 RepID=A0A0D6LWV2_9BILA|nr:hypothetical protein ANCCEY_04376 [Ancylostoma ceylanicum]